MLSIQPLALPSARQVLKPAQRYQRPGLALLPVRARKQSKKQDVGQDVADLASDVLPADLQKLSKLAKDELQHQLEVRGLDKNGNKEELANRLLDNLIAQESVLSTNPPERVKLQQQLEQTTAAAAAPARRGRRTSRKATASADPQPETPVIPGSPLSADSVIAAAAAVTAEPVEAPSAARRGRKTSRKATTSADPLPSPADIVAAAVAEDVSADVKPTRRGRKTSRKATTSADPLPTPADIVAAAEGTSAEAKPTRRGRKTSRKATASADPLDASTQDPIAAAAEAAAAVESATEAVTGVSKRGRRSKTTAAEPSPVAAAEDSAPAKASRARRTSRKSSVLEPETTDAAPTAAAVEAPARRGRCTSSAKAARPAENTTATAAAAASTPADASAGTPTVSRAKLLAQQLAKREIATHGTGAAAAAAAAAATAATAAGGDAATAEPAAAAPGSAWVGADELLYAGSQAQSDSLLIGGDNSMQAVGAQSTFSIDNGSVDEVIAQLTAERGMADEPQLRPEANLSPFDVMMPPSAGAADAAASWSAVAPPPAAGVDTDGQHPSMTDCVAAVEEPLTSSAEAVEVDEGPDSAMAAFDHMYVHIASPAAAEADLQHPNMSDCVAAVEEPLLTKTDAVVLDEAPDAAMAAFDHTSLDSAAAAAVAGGNQTPNLQDIVLAVESSSLPASLDESLGEDEEPDVALAAFDRMVPEAAAATAATVPLMKSADEGYDQAYLDPLQPSALGATVGSGSVDLADAESEIALPAAAAAKSATAAVTEVKAAATVAVVPEKQPQQQKQGGQESADFSVLVQRWWASVMQMFEDWQKNLSGPK